MGLILSAVYCSNLKAMIIIPKLTLPFNSLKEMLKTDVLCQVPRESFVHQMMQVKVHKKKHIYQNIWVVSRQIRSMYIFHICSITSTSTRNNVIHSYSCLNNVRIRWNTRNIGNHFLNNHLLHVQDVYQIFVGVETVVCSMENCNSAISYFHPADVPNDVWLGKVLTSRETEMVDHQMEHNSKIRDISNSFWGWI